MSDLIEKLETYYKKGVDAKSQNAAMIYEDKFRELCWAAAPEILTALRTLQRIEGLAKTNGVLEFYAPRHSSSPWMVSVTTDYESQDFIADTLPLAVEAAEGGK